MDAQGIKILSAGGIDYETGIDRFGGNEEMFERFIRRFLDDMHFEELLRDLNSEDAETCFRTAHTLKGVVGNLSFAEYHDAITPVAELLRDGKIEEARAGMPAVLVAHTKVVAAIQEIN